MVMKARVLRNRAKIDEYMGALRQDRVISIGGRKVMVTKVEIFDDGRLGAFVSHVPYTGEAGE